jgi:hypothetical protein
MKHATLRSLSILITLIAGLLVAGSVHAQDITVRGRVIGPDNAPLGDQRVVLHRVDTSGGATIAETRSGVDGSFELNATAEPDTSALLFVAARYDEELYIGPPFRPGDETALVQEIQVGVPSMSATAMMQGGEPMPMPRGPRPETTSIWLLLLIPLVGVLGVAAYAMMPRNRIPPVRARFIRVAELDERMETAPAAHREALAAERRQLVAELREG